MHLSRRDLVLQSPRSDGLTTGKFALRSPVRPSPVATVLVELVGIAVVLERLAQKPRKTCEVASLAEPEFNDVTMVVDSSVNIQWSERPSASA
jgi:hypothetical protein